MDHIFSRILLTSSSFHNGGHTSFIQYQRPRGHYKYGSRQDGKTGLPRQTYTFCPHFFMGLTKILCLHPLICLSHPVPFFVDFCGRKHYYKLLQFLSFRGVLSASPLCTALIFCREGQGFNPVPLTISVHPPYFLQAYTKQT